MPAALGSRPSPSSRCVDPDLSIEAEESLQLQARYEVGESRGVALRTVLAWTTVSAAGAWPAASTPSITTTTDKPVATTWLDRDELAYPAPGRMSLFDAHIEMLGVQQPVPHLWRGHRMIATDSD